MKILITGGAGYIGSHMVKMATERGFDVVVLDSLENGYEDAVKSAKLIVADLEDRSNLDLIFQNEKFDAVIHFASYIQVAESIQHPDKYYKNNVCNTLNLLNAMVKSGVNKLVFSSTAAIFGTPQYIPIDEDHTQSPINPYGESKLFVEKILQSYEKSYGLHSICLRYFNAAGASPDGEIGERHQPETHLIPLVLQAASGRRAEISIFGDDYDTNDGSCIRDYIHVNDLCEAHFLALEKMSKDEISSAYNLGTGRGYSVKEIIQVAEEVTGKRIKTVVRPRRNGDPAVLVADYRKAEKELGWSASLSDLPTIILHAWNWERKQ